MAGPCGNGVAGNRGVQAGAAIPVVIYGDNSDGTEVYTIPTNMYDDNGMFVRHTIYNISDGTVNDTYDTEVDMSTPYVVSGVEELYVNTIKDLNTDITLLSSTGNTWSSNTLSSISITALTGTVTINGVNVPTGVTVTYAGDKGVNNLATEYVVTANGGDTLVTTTSY